MVELGREFRLLFRIVFEKIRNMIRRRFSQDLPIRGYGSCSYIPDDHDRRQRLILLVFAPGPTGRDVNTLHSQVKGLTQQMVDRANTEHSTLKRLRRSLRTLEDQVRELVQGDREQNKKLKTMLESTQRDFDRLSWHHHNLRRWSFEVQWHLHPFRHYRERPYVAPTAPVALLTLMILLPVVLDAMIPMLWLEMLPLEMRAMMLLLLDRATRRKHKWSPDGHYRGTAGGQGGAPPARECTYSSFMKCNPTSFHGNEGAVELCRWFEKTESVFSISECLPKCNNCGKMGHKEKDCRSRNVASGTYARSAVVCYECGERGHKSNACLKKADRQGGNVRGQAYVVRDAKHNQGPNVVT
ncbi:putative reverse transcriptase domain-containing protein, partial [Tanacetum coccineum]